MLFQNNYLAVLIEKFIIKLKLYNNIMRPKLKLKLEKRNYYIAAISLDA